MDHPHEPVDLIDTLSAPIPILGALSMAALALLVAFG